MKIYLASPFFNSAEIINVELAEKYLRNKGFDVWSPREHEVRSDVGTIKWSDATFKMDRDAIDECDLVVVLYYGNYSDTGTAWECGYACATNKPVILVHLHDENTVSNLMLHSSVHANVNGIAGLNSYDFENMPKTIYNGLII